MITFSELKQRSSKLYPAILLDKYFSHSARKKFRNIFLWVLCLVFVVMVVAPYLEIYESIPANISNWFSDATLNLRGLFFALFAIWAFVYLFEAFYLSYYFSESEIDFDVARMVYLSDSDDLTKGFLESPDGRYAMLRLGIDQKQILRFIQSGEPGRSGQTNQSGRKKIAESDLDLEIDSRTRFVSIKDYGTAIYKTDRDFAHFLNQYRITEELFLGCLDWVDNDEWQIRNSERWWIRSNLSRVQSIGRNWSFGKTYLIEKFGHPIVADPIYRGLGDRWRIHKNQVEQIESILVKDSGANVMLISPTSETGIEIIASLGKMIFNGQILTEIEDRRIFVLDTNLMITESADRKVFEQNIIDILRQAHHAGNVILVFPQMSSFLEGANGMGVNAASLFAEVLSSSRVQVIAISNKKGFHEVIETNYDLMQHFEKVLIKDINREVALRILQQESHYLEAKHSIFFTYQSLSAVAEGADRYFMTASYADKVIDLLQEVAAKVKVEKTKIVTAEDVYQILSIKTGVPQGEISADEKEKLVSLEETLHKRVIGQNEAIEAISEAMRRARAGINNPKRPIGSFLFLGPTGVGKTETTKALAESFFKSEKNIIRLDMSEFTGVDAVDKLIGSFTTKQTGILAEKIINQQYGVLLLDEFEKTTKEVMDLFLQIIDEGQFTDSRGQNIVARNLIIVATSNAGSDMIYEATANSQGGEISGFKNKIVDELVKQKIFKPELLNRFDGIILFHSLSAKHLREVAKLMLRKLETRLSDKGITMEISEDLLDYLIKVGNDRKFGARAMNRVIQDEVESIVADKIIKGEIVSGSRVSFRKSVSGKLEISPVAKIVD